MLVSNTLSGHDTCHPSNPVLLSSRPPILLSSCPQQAQSFCRRGTLWLLLPACFKLYLLTCFKLVLTTHMRYYIWASMSEGYRLLRVSSGHNGKAWFTERLLYKLLSPSC